jgi:perosamine synthetase
MFDDVIEFIKKKYKSQGLIPIHEPRFIGNEKKYLNECIDSTFVSSSGIFVDKFEEKIAEYTGAKYAIAVCNGTAALHIALKVCNVTTNDEVVTQPLTFVATCNAIHYCGAKPVFVDVEKETLGMSPESLLTFLENNTTQKNHQCINNKTGRIIKACLPMHTFGHPCRIDVIKDICNRFHINLIEDAAESLGSSYKNRNTGTFGSMGILSFNGNKIITAGGGGCILTSDKRLANQMRHLATTAKIPHEWDFFHDVIGYNYRMPNLNAALLVAQMENLNSFVTNKRKLALEYSLFFEKTNLSFVHEPFNCQSNYWLNSIILDEKNDRDLFLKETNAKNIMTRPIWTLMNKLPMFKDSQCSDLSNAEWLQSRVVNIPSSVII